MSEITLAAVEEMETDASAVRRRAEAGATVPVVKMHVDTYDRLLALARRALEQPTPTGEVTREHREAAQACCEGMHGVFLRPMFETIGDQDRAIADIAQLLATREAAAYQRGLESAQGGWVAGYRAGEARALQLIRDRGWMSGYLCDGIASDLSKLPPSPPSDTSKGGGA